MLFKYATCFITSISMKRVLKRYLYLKKLASMKLEHFSEFRTFLELLDFSKPWAFFEKENIWPKPVVWSAICKSVNDHPLDFEQTAAHPHHHIKSTSICVQRPDIPLTCENFGFHHQIYTLLLPHHHHEKPIADLFHTTVLINCYLDALVWN